MKIRHLAFALLAALSLPALAEKGPAPLPAVPAVDTAPDTALDLSPLDDAVAVCSAAYRQCSDHCDETVDPGDPDAWMCYQTCLCWYCGAPCP